MTIIEGCSIIVTLTLVVLAMAWINLKTPGHTFTGRLLRTYSYWLIIVCLILICIITFVTLDGVLW